MSPMPANLPTLGSNMSRTASAMDTGSGQPQADLQYWQHVFDEAHLRLAGGSPASLPDAGRGPLEPRPQAHRLSGGPVGGQAALDQGRALPASRSSGQAGSALCLTGPASSQDRLMGGGVCLSVPRTPSSASAIAVRDHGRAGGAASSDVASSAREAAAQPAPGALQVSPWLQAHVVQTAGGAWQVLLRSSRPLTAAQALAAVADAMGMPGMPEGEIATVVLNGQRVYTRSTTTGRGIEFDLTC